MPSFVVGRCNMLGAIVEGKSDELKLLKALPDQVKCYFMDGTRYGSRLKAIVNRATSECGSVVAIPDPDAEGDKWRAVFQREYPDIPVIVVDPARAHVQQWRGHRVRIKYGVEFCSEEYIREILSPYL